MCVYMCVGLSCRSVRLCASAVHYYFIGKGEDKIIGFVLFCFHLVVCYFCCFLMNIWNVTTVQFFIYQS